MCPLTCSPVITRLAGPVVDRHARRQARTVDRSEVLVDHVQRQVPLEARRRVRPSRRSASTRRASGPRRSRSASPSGCRAARRPRPRACPPASGDGRRRACRSLAAAGRWPRDSRSTSHDRRCTAVPVTLISATPTFASGAALSRMQPSLPSGRMRPHVAVTPGGSPSMASWTSPANPFLPADAGEHHASTCRGRAASCRCRSPARRPARPA